MGTATSVPLTASLAVMALAATAQTRSTVDSAVTSRQVRLTATRDVAARACTRADHRRDSSLMAVMASDIWSSVDLDTAAPPRCSTWFATLP
ncbi:hypothetical protein KRM28CT15_00910 [Krasilnikovia sp. M28-CT-15]